MGCLLEDCKLKLLSLVLLLSRVPTFSEKQIVSQITLHTVDTRFSTKLKSKPNMKKYRFSVVKSRQAQYETKPSQSSIHNQRRPKLRLGLTRGDVVWKVTGHERPTVETRFIYNFGLGYQNSCYMDKVLAWINRMRNISYPNKKKRPVLVNPKLIDKAEPNTRIIESSSQNSKRVLCHCCWD